MSSTSSELLEKNEHMRYTIGGKYIYGSQQKEPIMAVPDFKSMNADELLACLDVFMGNQDWASAADCAEEFLTKSFPRKRKMNPDTVEIGKEMEKIAVITYKLQRATMELAEVAAVQVSALADTMREALVKKHAATTRAKRANDLMALFESPFLSLEEPASPSA